MGETDLELVLGLVARLSVEQRERLLATLTAGEGEAAVAAVLEARLGVEPACLHCGSEKVQRWGKSHGLQRWRCRACAHSFNALTGTSLARLRKKAVWLTFAAILAQGLTVAAAAERCCVHPSTSFRWRHRFLRAAVADRERLNGIVEADETYFRLSFKGWTVRLNRTAYCHKRQCETRDVRDVEFAKQTLCLFNEIELAKGPCKAV